MGGCRTFLFLQGPLSPLFSRIADRFAAADHRVLRVNLCIGDRLHWRRGGAVDYRGTVHSWPAFIDALMAREGVADLILHGDRRIYHRMAGELTRARGIHVIATELGYLRPDWMTIERDGTSTGSHFPDDLYAIRAIAAAVGPVVLTPKFANSFWLVAAPDVTYNLANVVLWFLYPHYRRHTIYHPVIEYCARVEALVGGPSCAGGEGSRREAQGGQGAVVRVSHAVGRRFPASRSIPLLEEWFRLLRASCSPSPLMLRKTLDW